MEKPKKIKNGSGVGLVFHFNINVDEYTRTRDGEVLGISEECKSIINGIEQLGYEIGHTKYEYETV